MPVMIIFVLLLFLNTMNGSTDYEINLLVHSLSNIRRYCVELPKLFDNQTINVTEFGWYTAFIAPRSVNACNITDLGVTFPNGFNSRTLLVLFEHECDIIEHAWNIQQQFGKEISLMIVKKQIETPWHHLNSSSMTVPISIPVLIFQHNNFIKMNKNLNESTNNIRFSIDYPSRRPQKFPLTSLFMFPLVLITLLIGNFWAADEFVTIKNGITKYVLPSSTLSPDDILASGSSEQQSMLPMPLSPDSNDAPVSLETILSAMDKITTASSRLTAIRIVPLWFIFYQLFLIVIFLLLSFYVRIIRTYIFPIIFGIAATRSFTLCLDRLSYFVPIVRRYRIPSYITDKLGTYQCYRLTFFTIFAFCMSMAIVIVWYINRQSDWAWILQDILGATLCIVFISTIRLGNMSTIIILLVCACLIDVFFVFITPHIPWFQLKPSSTATNHALSRNPSVMEQIALGTEANDSIAPLVFILPKFVPESEIDPCSPVRPRILGFGDVVIPSLLLTYCKFFDILSENRWPTYYTQSVISYFVGLSLVYVAGYFMNTAQPALLYLIPCIFLSTIITGYYRRDLKKFFTDACFEEFFSENVQVIQQGKSFIACEWERHQKYPETRPSVEDRLIIRSITMNLDSIKLPNFNISKKNKSTHEHE